MAMDDHQQGELTCLGSGVGEEVAGKTNTQAAFLESNRGRTVVVKLNSDLYYRGILAGLDGYMNISMVQAEEYVNGQLRQTHGVAVINGKAVLDISIVASEENQNRTESSNTTQHQELESSNTTQHQQPESSNTTQHQEPESSNTTQHQEPESSNTTQHQQTDNRTNKEKMRDRRREQTNARTGTSSKGFRKKDKHIYHDP